MGNPIHPRGWERGKKGNKKYAQFQLKLLNTQIGNRRTKRSTNQQIEDDCLECEEDSACLSLD